MLPAADLAEIITNITALNLEPNTVTAVLGAAAIGPVNNRQRRST